MPLNAAEPAMPTLELAPAEEQRCRDYGRARLWASVAELVILLTVLPLLTFTGASGWLLEVAAAADAPRWVRDAVYLVFLGVIVRVSLFPVQLVSEHWLDRRFGLSRQGFGGWFGEWLCRSALFGVATVVMLLPVVETLRWWPWLVLPWCLAFILVRHVFYDWLYYPLLARFYPVRFLRNETFLLPGIGKRTLPVYEVQVSHRTTRANAAIRLRGPKTAIYVTDTLIDEFTDGEERVVMAHEFGHLYDRLHLEERTRAGVAQAHRKLKFGSAQLAAGLCSLLLMTALAPLLHLRGVHDLAGFPLLAALTFAFAYALSPFLCAEARRDERDADEYALAITGDVTNYVSVMRKLRLMNLEDSCAHPLGRILFDTHPSYAERVHLALQHRRRYSRRGKTPHFRGWRHVQRHGRR